MRKSQRSGLSIRKILRARDALFVGAFLTCVLLTFFATLWVWGRDDAQQKEFRSGVLESQSRWMASPLRPAIIASRAVRLFVSGYDNFCALRPPFIRWNGLAKTQILKTSTSPEVVLGKDNWLFLNTEGSLDDYRRLHPFSPAELLQLKNYFETQNRSLQKRGIKFLIVIPPDKQTIYPELMPESLAPAPGQTHLDQFLEAMKNSPVEILDLRPVLRAAKAQRGKVYFRDDSHWNDWGAYAAYAATANRLKKWYPNLRVMPESELRVKNAIRKGADLPDKLGIEKDIAENIQTLSPKPPRAFPKRESLPNTDSYYVQQAVTRTAQGDVPRALVFGDSFFFLTSYLPLLSQHFGRGHWNWLKMNTAVNEDLVRQTKPDVVILERVERIIFSIPDSDKLQRDLIQQRKGGLP